MPAKIAQSNLPASIETKKPPRLGRPKQAAQECGNVSMPTWWRYTKLPGFPALMYVTKRCVLVDLDEQAAWIESRAQSRKAA